MTAADPDMLAYLRRRDVSPQWRGFVRALVETLDGHLDAASRNALMRAVGARLGAALPLPPCAELPEMEARMNDALALIDWGCVRIEAEVDAPGLRITHNAAPLVPAGEDPAGNWVIGALEGLYGVWLGGQPGADAALVPRYAEGDPRGAVVLRYGRG
ncbi:hypothetical protein M0638_07995 [Roseomonas sp. NAR14]|uniref:Cellulose synthase subunit D n=1 Tax=Roseomonas acroporae TaxID=2937791 RepID=A0A9X2BTH3_9PROT|nr:cellulose biosynthesis protein BcsD [Roseomonas acroporae]MCK8784317.1 hypothetical protein [Roseomonas acroporae]